jgi:erythromycin esterase-like protein
VCSVQRHLAVGHSGRSAYGQLVRERHGADDTVLVGFGTYQGNVIASEMWGGPVRRIRVPAAVSGSIEGLWHDAVPDADSLAVFPPAGGPAWADEVRGHRAIGVVYRPRRERLGNYVPTILRRRYDAFLHCDRSAALTRLHQLEPATAEAETMPAGE